MSRRPPPRPVSNTAARGVLVVAVVALLGFLILKNVDSGATVDTGGTETDTTTTAVTTPTSATAPATTAVDKASFQVLVANASGISGSARRQSDKMKADGFTMAEPSTNNTKADTTTIFFLSGYEAAAAAVAASINISDVQPMPSPPPVELGQAQILVNLGKDIATDAANQVTTTTT